MNRLKAKRKNSTKELLLWKAFLIVIMAPFFQKGFSFHHLPKRPNAVSASDCIVVLWRLSPTVPEKILKLSSSEVVSKTASSSFAMPNSSKNCMFSVFSLIIQIAISITNRRICGVLVAGFLCFFRIWTNVAANSACVVPALSNVMAASWDVVNFKIWTANPIITSCSFWSSALIA